MLSKQLDGIVRLASGGLKYTTLLRVMASPRSTPALSRLFAYGAAVDLNLLKGVNMTSIRVERVDVRPKAGDFWVTQGHQFQSFTQALNEFIDNSVANFGANPNLPTPEIRMAALPVTGTLYWPAAARP